MEETVQKHRMKANFILPAKVWLLMLVGAAMQGISQTFTVSLSGYVQRLFGYSNQEGGFLIVIGYLLLDCLYIGDDDSISSLRYSHR